jgi:hypothetical protein
MNIQLFNKHEHLPIIKSWCELRNIDMISDNKFYCPICDTWDYLSPYLKDVFKDYPRSLWFANMVTHHRHNHIESWDKCWGKYGSYYRGSWFLDYDYEKSKFYKFSLSDLR